MRSIGIATNMDQMDHSTIRSIRAFLLGSNNVPSSRQEVGRNNYYRTRSSICAQVKGRSHRPVSRFFFFFENPQAPGGPTSSGSVVIAENFSAGVECRTFLEMFFFLLNLSTLVFGNGLVGGCQTNGLIQEIPGKIIFFS